MNDKEFNQIKYNQAKEKAYEIITLLSGIKCNECEGCPLNKHCGCSRQDLIGYLEEEFNKN